MISIVVPVYNAEKYLEKCIDSILAQTYPNWELVLVDNGSTDESMEICRAYANRDVRITAFHQYRNQGVSVARNLGMERCSGEFITFIDADDWVKKDYLEKLIKLQKRQNADMVICEYDRVYDEDRVKEPENSQKNGKYSIRTYNVRQYLKYYLLEGNPHCWGVLYKNSILDQLKFMSGLTIGEDLLFVLEAALRAEKIAVTDYAGYQYYINVSGAMLKKFTPSYMDQIICWEKALKRIEETYPELLTKVESILVVSVLLVVGKIAELSHAEQKEYKEEMEECYRIFIQYGKKKEIRKYLPSGYPAKVLFYRFVPKVYIFLYGKLKKIKR